MANQALALALPMATLFFFVVPDLLTPIRWLAGMFCLFLASLVMTVGLSRQAILAAGQKNLWRAWRDSSRASGRHPLRAAVIVGNRFVLLGFAVLNLHLFWQFGLWAAEDLAGFDIAVLRQLCSLGNGAYLALMTALAWWLLMPFFEAANFLFYVDSRSRFEALDLWLRVEENFSTRTITTDAASLALAFLFVGPASCQDLPGIQQAKQEIAQVRQEMRSADPYPGGKHWLPELRRIGQRLQQTGGFQWFDNQLDKLSDNDRAADLQTLEAMQERLRLIEQSFHPAGEGRPLSKEQIKALLPKARRDETPPEKTEPKEPEKKDDFEVREGRGNGGPAGPGLVAPVSSGAAGAAFAYVFLAIILVVLLGALAAGVSQWLRNRQPRKASVVAKGSLSSTEAVDMPDPNRQNVRTLWDQADQLARAGNHLEATRVLYLGVLALLHQHGLIRYERTRTNGEYARHLRRQTTVHQPFVHLTGIFEQKWFGERACGADDYHSCRGLAETIREGAMQVR
jgi:hypothetical protein